MSTQRLSCSSTWFRCESATFLYFTRFRDDDMSCLRKCLCSLAYAVSNRLNSSNGTREYSAHIFACNNWMVHFGWGTSSRARPFHQLLFPPGVVVVNPCPVSYDNYSPQSHENVFSSFFLFCFLSYRVPIKFSMCSGMFYSVNIFINN